MARDSLEMLGNTRRGPVCLQYMSTGPDAMTVESLMMESRWLRRLARSLVSEDAEDVVQDTYLAAVVSPPVDGPPATSLARRGAAELRAHAAPRAGTGLRLRAISRDSTLDATYTRRHYRLRV
jgi:hypothetical protein